LFRVVAASSAVGRKRLRSAGVKLAAQPVVLGEARRIAPSGHSRINGGSDDEADDEEKPTVAA
jgi:hypothetical protein